MTRQTFGAESAIEALFAGFCACTLPDSDWTHGAHFAVALWLVVKCPQIDPERELPGMIRRYNESVGRENSDVAGYHETITQASLRAVRAHVRDQPDGAALHAVHADLMAGPLGRSDWPFAFWSRARLFSVAARREWIEPDISSLPW